MNAAAVLLPLNVNAAPLTVPVNVGAALNTTLPVPVLVVTPVPPCATDKAVVKPLRLVMSPLAPLAAAPRLARAPAAVVAPVPPFATASVPLVMVVAFRFVSAEPSPANEAALMAPVAPILPVTCNSAPLRLPVVTIPVAPITAVSVARPSTSVFAVVTDAPEPMAVMYAFATDAPKPDALALAPNSVMRPDAAMIAVSALFAYAPMKVLLLAVVWLAFESPAWEPTPML